MIAFLQLAVAFATIATSVSLDSPFYQDVSFRSLYQNSGSTITIPSWDNLPFSSVSSTVNKDGSLHIQGSSGSKDCFMVLDGQGNLFGSSRQNLNLKEKLQLTRTYSSWKALGQSFTSNDRLVTSLTKKYDFFVVTSKNVYGVQLSDGTDCGTVIESSPLMSKEAVWGESIQAVASSENYLWIASISNDQTPVIFQVNILTGAIEQTIALSVGSGSTSAPTATVAMTFVPSWNKLFVSTDLALFTVAFTGSDLSSYTMDHEWITGVLDTAPTTFAFDNDNNNLWLAQSAAIHKMDNQGRIWRYGYHQGAPFGGDITSLAILNGYVYASSATAGIARMKLSSSSSSAGQEDTLLDNKFITLMNGENDIKIDQDDPWKWNYLAGNRYLPDNQVQALLSSTPSAASKEGAVLAFTNTGIAVLESSLWTLDEKAKSMESFQYPRHDRRKLTADCGFSIYGNTDSYYKQVTDNDGLWTAMHAMGEAYGYATTGDDKLRQEAWRAFEGLEMLVKSPGAYPRYPARTFCYLADNDQGCGDGGIWNASIVYDGLLFKSDTSSDEIDGHLAVYPLIYDMIAQTTDEKARVYALIDGITRGIVDNDLYLIDPLTNKPTKWGFWNPSEVNGNPNHYSERGMNSLEILSFLSSAYSITRDVLYKTTFMKLVEEHGYVKNMMNVKIDNPEDDNHSDNELMMLAYHCMFYSWSRISEETEPQFKAEMYEMVKLAIPSLERAWMLIGSEFSPLWTGVFAGVAKQSASRSVINRSVWTLRHWAIDLINWPVDHSLRWDVNLQPFFVRDSTNEIMRQIRPPIERTTTHWNSDPFAQKTGSGYGEHEPAVWRLPYYLMKYYGLI